MLAVVALEELLEARHEPDILAHIQALVPEYRPRSLPECGGEIPVAEPAALASSQIWPRLGNATAALTQEQTSSGSPVVCEQ